ncbi:MAG TPA: hypothetical protein H9830_05465 [Candidatus Agrococcus pullicola]|uniref:Uncharacterized protein n=1 Tax=Candidatus Agrococcus pullicola TaxID=2838429 RepID=A0A9D1YTT0_9MICO|nr:hypothetical protein [uncultured Agrococcus sp.]HIY65709.1 hypothetical protein [Candidatus Agrococcus pullicola]
MTSTTIKVTAELRDILKQQARGRGRTLNAHLQALADEESRRQRFDELKASRERYPPDDDYRAEAEEWLGAGWN